MTPKGGDDTWRGGRALGECMNNHLETGKDVPCEKKYPRLIRRIMETKFQTVSVIFGYTIF